MVKKLEFIVGKEEKVAPLVILFYNESREKIIAYRLYLDRTIASAPNLKFHIRNEDNSNVHQYGSFYLSPYRSIKTLTDFYKREHVLGDYEIIKVKDEEDVYKVGRERAFKHAKEELSHILEKFNTDVVEKKFFNNWKDLMSN